MSEKVTWRALQEVRGTPNYTQRVRGALASNMPDKNNEHRYDSWISRSGRAGNPAWMKLDVEQVMDSAARLGKADGAGAGETNSTARCCAPTQRRLPVRVFDMPRDAQVLQATRTPDTDSSFFATAVSPPSCQYHPLVRSLQQTLSGHLQQWVLEVPRFPWQPEIWRAAWPNRS